LQASPPPEYIASAEEFKAHIEPILSYLSTARPTAVNLGGAMRRLSCTLSASIGAGKDTRTIAHDLITEARLVADEDVGRNKMMAKLGAEWLIEQVKRSGGSGKELNVLTVCNTGSLATSVCLLCCARKDVTHGS
jgi:methylthioribose-1-phosphate isomerase